MKFYSGDNTFQFTWDQLVAAFWQRYPNPHSKHVLSEDVIERKVVGGKLVSKRIICKTNSCPRWGERFVKGLTRYVYVVEESVVDPASRTFTTYTRNIGLQTIMSIDEKCTYTVSPEERTHTLCEKQAAVGSSVYGFTGILSSFGVQRFRKNVNNAVNGFNHILHKLYTPDNLVIEQKSSKDKIRDSARKATELAKTGAEKAKAKVPRSVACDT